MTPGNTKLTEAELDVSPEKKAFDALYCAYMHILKNIGNPDAPKMTGFLMDAMTSLGEKYSIPLPFEKWSGRE